VRGQTEFEKYCNLTPQRWADTSSRCWGRVPKRWWSFAWGNQDLLRETGRTVLSGARATAGYRTKYRRQRRYSQGVRRHPASLNIENSETYTCILMSVVAWPCPRPIVLLTCELNRIAAPADDIAEWLRLCCVLSPHSRLVGHRRLTVSLSIDPFDLVQSTRMQPYECSTHSIYNQTSWMDG
jgi:hypothetical protein